MIVAVAPHSPLLVEAFDPHHLPEIASVREAAVSAVRRLVDDDPDAICVVAGQIPAARRDLAYDETAGGTLAGFGIDARAGGSELVLPADATVGAWLLDHAGWRGRRGYVAPQNQERIEQAEALLVLADGTNCRTERAPGHFDPSAAEFDADVALALARGDAEALRDIDAEQAEALGVAGWAALAALGTAVAKRVADGADVEPELLHESAPLGVGYTVASWRVG